MENNNDGLKLSKFNVNDNVENISKRIKDEDEIIKKSLQKEVDSNEVSFNKLNNTNNNKDLSNLILEYSKLNNNKVHEDINELNRLVINYCTKNIIGEIESYLKYKRDVSTIAMPIEHPVYLHNDNTLEFKRFI